MIFAIDYDGTFSRDPRLFREFVYLLRTAGHDAVCVTGRSDEGQFGAEVREAVLGTMQVVFADGGWKAAAAERAGYKVDVWIDDMPEGIRELRADFAAVKNARSAPVPKPPAEENLCQCGHARALHRGAIVGSCFGCFTPEGQTTCWHFVGKETRGL